jgi:outer membrane immunogenic protein
MKKISLLFCTIITIINANAQGSLLKGKTQFNIGIGLSEWGIPVYGGFDYGVDKDITLGGELSIRSYREKYKNIFYRHSIIGISGNGNYHFNRILNIPKKFDFYAGLNIGFYAWSSPKNYPGNYNSGLGLGVQVGGRYYLNNKTGINVEFGGGNAFSGGKIGLTFKLK